MSLNGMLGQGFSLKAHIDTEVSEEYYFCFCKVSGSAKLYDLDINQKIKF